MLQLDEELQRLKKLSPDELEKILAEQKKSAIEMGMSEETYDFLQNMTGHTRMIDETMKMYGEHNHDFTRMMVEVALMKFSQCVERYKRKVMDKCNIIH